MVAEVSAGLGITTRGQANGARVVIQGPTGEPERNILSSPRVPRQYDSSGRLARGDVRNLTAFGGRSNAGPARVYEPRPWDKGLVAAGWQRLAALVSPWQEGSTYLSAEPWPFSPL